ncbi:hypothetical protein AcV5_007550 [Taiwanofungus camphoratus]|nr:hypothetical protein AcV5_007550 [Antrodia cinnamomea]
MSTRPRPKPRRPAPAATRSSPGPSSTPAPISLSVATINVDDEDARFMRNRTRTAQSWKKLKQIAEEKEALAKQRAVDDSADEEDSDSSPRERRYKKKVKGESRPHWTKMPANAISLLSDDEDDEILRRVEAKTPNDMRESNSAQKHNRKRPRSRSRSITPPPALPIHAIQHARNAIRQFMGVAPRPASPTFIGDDSNDTIVLDPELESIARRVRTEASQRHMIHSTDGDSRLTPEGGGPETVAIKLLWQPHPLNPTGQSGAWAFKIKRHDTFHQLFDEAADLASVVVDNLIVSYDNKRVFPSATPHGLGIWAEAELEASDNITYEYLRATRRQRSVSVQPLEASHDRSPSHTRSPSPTADELDGDSGAESAASDGDKFRLTLRSAKTKDITLTVRPTTTCGAIVKAFLKKAGLPEQHAGTAKGMGRKGRASAPSLMVDGEKMNSASEIGDADLEDGDLVEVVGL